MTAIIKFIDIINSVETGICTFPELIVFSSMTILNLKSFEDIMNSIDDSIN